MQTTINYKGNKITISSLSQSSAVWHGMPRTETKVNIKVNNANETTFEYYSNKFEKNDLYFSLYCFVTDAISGDMDIDEFASELRYDKVSELLKTYKACQEQAKKAKEVFSFNLYDFTNWLQDKFDL